MSIQYISAELNLKSSDVINLISDLKELGLIKQDGKSVRAGVNWDDKEAIYYTVVEKRDMLDML